MESLHQEQACRMSVPRRNISSRLPDLCSNSSVCKITDETFPYMSGIFDETMDPSYISNEPVATVNLPEQVNLKTVTKTQDEVFSSAGSETKAAYNSWLSIPVEGSPSIDFSMSMTSAQGDHEDKKDVTESNSKADIPDTKCHSLESVSGMEKSDSLVKSNNSTFDIAKEQFSVLNLTKPVSTKTTGSNNVTFEKSEELQGKSSTLSCTISNDNASVGDKHLEDKCLNLTVDVNCCGSSNSTVEHPKQKLNETVDITQSNGQKQEKIDEGRTCSKDCEKQTTYAEETNATVDLTAGATTEDAKPGSLNVEPVHGTFVKHNLTTDVTYPEPAPNSTMTEIKSSDSEIPEPSNTICGMTKKESPVSSPSAPVNIAAPVRVDVTVGTDRILDISEIVGTEEQQDQVRRRNGMSDGEGCLNLDTSQSSTFSMDEILHLRRCPFVISTPIVLERGFDKLGSLKPTNIQKQLSVINSINIQTNNDTAGVSKHDGLEDSKTNQLSVKSDTCSQIQKFSSNSTSTSATSEAGTGNKPLSKLAVRRKIPQPAFKSNIPKTQLPPRPSTVQLNSAVVKSKATTATQALIQPEMLSSALHSTRRTVQLNKGKTLSSSKNTSTASTVKSSSVATSTGTCNLTADKKAGNTCTAFPKLSGLPPPGRGRFGLKPPGSAVSSEEISHAQTNNKPTGLSDLQNQRSCAEAPAGSEEGEGVQKNVDTPTDITLKRADADCGNCKLLQEKLRAFHEELGEFLQELGRPADCKKWVLLQQNLESCLEEMKSLQTDHR
ncbi:uncharacterized threonine-rich GPI-anchored glycoprotein PJ4664.02 isoform X2 [Silurus meridionalis]|uniref:uncharacterized threonine-rich GPI-anchored glycoprotein PJ4664.02 isoform X2 n=1 Tax=Silurus meridionalis TaxID=175797 RepID=UPI001EEA1323|nr:uncharacterized threonine-rich GPI-anchored glycoprotein PJ4664.02 isoform X2 [Silurus meridionalis]